MKMWYERGGSLTDEEAQASGTKMNFKKEETHFFKREEKEKSMDADEYLDLNTMVRGLLFDGIYVLQN